MKCPFCSASPITFRLGAFVNTVSPWEIFATHFSPFLLPLVISDSVQLQLISETIIHFFYLLVGLPHSECFWSWSLVSSPDPNTSFNETQSQPHKMVPWTYPKFSYSKYDSRTSILLETQNRSPHSDLPMGNVHCTRPVMHEHTKFATHPPSSSIHSGQLIEPMLSLSPSIRDIITITS